jgi:hypothetical protein
MQRASMSVETDASGRLYLSAELRQKYGEKFHVVEYEDRIELIPIDEDPLQAVRDEIGDVLEGESQSITSGLSESVCLGRVCNLPKQTAR